MRIAKFIAKCWNMFKEAGRNIDQAWRGKFIADGKMITSPALNINGSNSVKVGVRKLLKFQRLNYGYIISQLV